MGGDQCEEGDCAVLPSLHILQCTLSEGEVHAARNSLFRGGANVHRGLHRAIWVYIGCCVKLIDTRAQVSETNE